jgi:hypothetical protein
VQERQALVKGARVTSDIEAAPSRALEEVSGDTRSPEQALRMAIIKTTAVTVPVAIAFFVGLVALALRNEDPNWAGWLAMAVGIGIINGLFFGFLGGFVRSARLFE